MQSLQRVTDALMSLVRYNWDNELADFRDQGLAEPGASEDAVEAHIFLALVTLDQFLHGHNRTPREVVEQELGAGDTPGVD